MTENGCDVCRSITIALPGWKCNNCGEGARPPDPTMNLDQEETQ